MWGTRWCVYDTHYLRPAQWLLALSCLLPESAANVHIRLYSKGLDGVVGVLLMGVLNNETWKIANLKPSKIYMKIGTTIKQREKRKKNRLAMCFVGSQRTIKTMPMSTPEYALLLYCVVVWPCGDSCVIFSF